MDPTKEPGMPTVLRTAAVDSVTDAITRGRKRRSGRRNVGSGEIQVGPTTSVTAEELAEHGSKRNRSFHKRRRTSLIPGLDGDAEDDSNDEWEEHVEMDKDLVEAAVESMKVETSGKEGGEEGGIKKMETVPGVEQPEGNLAVESEAEIQSKRKAKELVRANALRKCYLRRYSVHLVLSLAHLLRLDSAASDVETQGFALSVTPEDIVVKKGLFEEGLSRLGLWVRIAFRATAMVQFLSKQKKLDGRHRLCSASERAIACGQEGHGDIMDMVTLVAAMLRNQGLRCRIVSPLQPVSFQPPKKAKTVNKVTGRARIVEAEPDQICETVLYAWLEIWSLDSHMWTPFDICEGFAVGERATGVIRRSMSRIKTVAVEEEEQKSKQRASSVRTRRGLRNRSKDPEQTPSRQLSSNLFSHVVAVENGALTDVTRRYTRNWVDVEKARAKGKSFDKVLDAISSARNEGGVDEARQSEIAEFDALASGEAVPTSVSAIQKHPYYVLGRHLKRYEIIHPKDPILGYIKEEPVFLRSNIRLLHTKDRWIRRMRVVREDAESLKSVRSKNGTDDTVELYGEWQTDPLEIPECIDGKVPRNFRGNIDLWTPDHLPKGTVHINMPCAKIAARKLDVDFAPAMTGFEVRGGRSIPKIEGIVVATEMGDMITDAARAAASAAAERQEKKAKEEACERWLKLLRTVNAREKVKKRYGNGMLGDGGTYEAAQKREGLRKAREEKFGTVGTKGKNESKAASGKVIKEIGASSQAHVHEYGDAHSVAGGTWAKSCKTCGLGVSFEKL